MAARYTVRSRSNICEVLCFTGIWGATIFRLLTSSRPAPLRFSQRLTPRCPSPKGNNLTQFGDLQNCRATSVDNLSFAQLKNTFTGSSTALLDGQDRHRAGPGILPPPQKKSPRFQISYTGSKSGQQRCRLGLGTEGGSV